MGDGARSDAPIRAFQNKWFENMNLRALYVTHDKPLQLQKVADGLWITVGETSAYSAEQAKAEFFRSAEVFKRPMRKARLKKTLGQVSE